MFRLDDSIATSNAAMQHYKILIVLKIKVYGHVLLGGDIPLDPH